MDIRDLTVRQIANALVIFAAAIPFGADAVKAALMTSAAESSYLRYANDGSYNDKDHEAIWRWYGDHFGGQRNLPLAECQRVYSAHLRQSLTFTHDAVAGSALTTKDSLGHYQQREMYGYGSVADLMDPAESTRIFLRGVPGDPTRVRHWSRTDKPMNLTIAQACQWVQGSEFPTGENYAPMEAVADQLIAHFGGLPETKDWWTELSASNWDEAKAELQGILDQKLDAAVNAITKYIEDGVVFRIQQLTGVEEGEVPVLTKYIEDGVAFRLEEVKGKLDALSKQLDALTPKA